MEGAALLAAVRSGDVDVVETLLAQGADPDAVGEEGVPALCLAVAAFDGPVADALVNGGADRDRRLPDGSTPLLRAVDSGSLELTITLFWDGDGHPTRTEPSELLARARHWHESGVVDELRRRTDATGPVERARVDGEWFSSCEEITLGGVTVRDGHGAILTHFESHFGIRPSVDELLARALAHPDPDHVVWFVVTSRLAERQDEETWLAGVALRAHPDPVRRRFAADLLMGIGCVDDSAFEQRVLEFLLPWGAEETDPHVLAGILCGLAQHSDPRTESVGLLYAEHPDPQVRGWVLRTLQGRDGTFSAEGWEVLVSLTRDIDAGIRQAACNRLAECDSRAPGVTDVLADCLDDEDDIVRIWAVYGLARRDDPRCLEGRPPVREFDDCWSWILDAASRYEER
ncbi:MAG: HEAT repeat domain-containing protein, partial [Streptomyces sp.]|nr:HEAT repeat domain-containing protein [Streptomyces sp.]